MATSSVVINSCPDGTFSTEPCGTGTPVQTPLQVIALPNGQQMIGHTWGGAPVVTPQGILDGEILGIDKKLLLIGIAAYFLFVKK